jgi:hypothetical protein
MKINYINGDLIIQFSQQPQHDHNNPQEPVNQQKDRLLSSAKQ